MLRHSIDYLSPRDSRRVTVLVKLLEIKDGKKIYDQTCIAQTYESFFYDLERSSEGPLLKPLLIRKSFVEAGAPDLTKEDAEEMNQVLGIRMASTRLSNGPHDWTQSVNGLARIHDHLRDNHNSRQASGAAYLAARPDVFPRWEKVPHPSFSTMQDGSMKPDFELEGCAILAHPRCIGASTDVAVWQHRSEPLVKSFGSEGRPTEVFLRGALFYSRDPDDPHAVKNVTRGVIGWTPNAFDWASDETMYRQLEEVLSTQDSWKAYSALPAGTTLDELFSVPEGKDFEEAINQAWNKVFPVTETSTN